LDQLLNYAWRFLVPLCLINLLVAAVWYWSGTWKSPVAVPVRWLVCAALIALPYHGLARILRGALPPPRKYSYAE
jgi:NADH-quinone oxidoreductase subunit H